MEFKSQHKQDEFIVKYFKGKRNGVFVDIGAHDGITYSNTYVLEKELGWTGICVEPMPIQYKSLEENRNCITYNCAIYNKNGSEKFILLEDDIYGYPNMLSGITKEMSVVHWKHILFECIDKKEVKRKQIIVETKVLNEILEEHKIYEIDFLSVDVEGAELKIISSINYDKFHIKVIVFENGESTPHTRDFLKSKNFSFYKRLGIDDVFINNAK